MRACLSYPCSSVDRAAGYEPVGREFESLQGYVEPDSSNGRAALLQGADEGSIPSSGTETKLHSVEKSASKIRNRVEQRDRDRIPHLPYWSNGYDVWLPPRRTRFNSGVRYVGPST